MVDSNKILSNLSRMGYETSESIAGRSSIRDLFPPANRCGIYVLHFENGWYYVGQAKDVVRRYLQHRQTFPDIQRISFRQTTQDDLNREEIAAISDMERAGALLRNISLVSYLRGQSRFDDVISPADQEKWLSDLTYADFTGVRRVEPELRERYHRQYQRYQQLPHVQAVTHVLRTYVRMCIPVPVRSEMEFWSITCLPSTGYRNGDRKCYSRINIFWQEVFSVVAGNNDFTFTWLLAASVLGATRRQISRDYPTIRFSAGGYISGGSDQCRVTVATVEEAVELLNDARILKAIRQFNLRLCRKGACNFARYHCFDLADELLNESAPELPFALPVRRKRPLNQFLNQMVKLLNLHND